jgi:predicted house-cleaning noncanonical NTP pyrophosphatase (MazG superfamily)
MEKKFYNKLIADQVPDNMTKLGKAFEIRTLDDDAEYERELLKKVVEEAEELRTAPTKEAALKEFADVLEVLDAISILKGFSTEEVLAMKEARFQKRGGFFKRIFLLWSQDDGYEANKNK